MSTELATLNDVANSVTTHTQSAVAQVELDTVLGLSQDALPCEASTFGSLIGEIRQKVTGHPAYDRMYRRVDLEAVARARKRQGSLKFPTFAIYSVFSKSAMFHITQAITYKAECNTTLDRTEELGISAYCMSDFASWYSDLNYESTLARLGHSISAVAPWNEKVVAKYTITHYFTGVIPNEARALIRSVTAGDLKAKDADRDADRDAGKFASSEIFLIEETHDWKVKGITEITPVPRNVDPLIVGIYNDACYLLGAFDVTPLEAFVAKEMSA